ncbi:16S rRNA (guanine(966)-N(2))-methyltransferase RsmD [Nakamurella sp.]|uniref:16S rRNA (guanine(966)-N(2))-methyltransferase RsmD n=1 Tax=Nakamurella sp. TaxID=1869182 RepID=UPI003783F69E
MTRIVAGRWRGRRLAVPKGVTTRPSSERVREALAGSLQATGGLDGARVLDLWAGTGALGLELASRGASSAVFVEKDRMALTALRANVDTFQDALGPTLGVVAGDVRTVLPRLTGPIDIVVADPPYDLPDADVITVLIALVAACVLAEHADLIVERSARSGEVPWPEPLTAVRAKKYGDTLLCYGRAP